MTRELTSHKINGLNEAILVTAMDEPGHGGASHHYRIELACCTPGCGDVRDIYFQKGPIALEGVNGISNEALLAIVEDRLKGFQSGDHACDSNELALGHVRNAMEALHDRTLERVARGVEGTHAK